jgi:hypothetical protein
MMQEKLSINILQLIIAANSPPIEALERIAHLVQDSIISTLLQVADSGTVFEPKREA